MKLCIDTNYFLDFYRQGKESLKILNDIEGILENIVFPEQVYKEFQRNVTKVQQDEIKKFKSSITSYSPSRQIRELKEYKEYERIKKDFEAKTKEIINVLKEISEDRSKDEIYNYIQEIYNNKEVVQLKNNLTLIEKGRNRQLLGNPPGTSDVTIGDEVIWEALLENVKDDLIIITNDRSFKDNKIYLQDEFKEETGHQLFILEKLSDAIKKLGEIPSDALIKYESETLLDPYMDEISKLPEFKDFSNAVYAAGSGIAMYIEGIERIKGVEFIRLYVGESNEEYNVRWNTFFHSKQGNKILVYDIIDNKAISLSEWREKYKNKPFI
ncbi:PIN domain-containing protein [Paenibacillus jamilae]|uniref:PIN-like domain-containing protein n=2 Tax=Paenibacillus jamilae TaxID=114136 RepID=UPI003D2A584A